MQVEGTETPDPHKRTLTTLDRNDNPIPPTCVHCGRREEYCDGWIEHELPPKGGKKN